MNTCSDDETLSGSSSKHKVHHAVVCCISSTFPISYSLNQY